MIERKIYLLDTNVLLHCPRALFEFESGCVGIAFPTLAELDNFKKESSERGYNAREVARLIDELRQTGNITNGISLDHGGTFKIFLLPAELEKIKLVDDQLIALCLQLKEEGYQIKLISKDLNIRIKGDALGIEVEDYQASTISKDNFYTGWREYAVSSGDLKFKVEDLLTHAINEYQFSINEFVLLKSHHNEANYRIFRYIGGTDFLEVSPISHLLWGLEPRNPHQAMALDLLLDDNIQLVALLGPSGTGKTFMILASMLYKVLCSHTFQKLLVSRPLVPLGPDIGYLPGDLDEKLYTWMQPIRDNLEHLLYHINMNSRTEINNGEESWSQKRHKRHKRISEDNIVRNENRKLSVESLTGPQGKVCLETITYMRGRSIPYQAIFIDEVQNLTPHEVKTLISRAGEGSKIILAGDPYQIDSQYLDFASNGLVIASEKFRGQAIFGTVYLQISERSLLSSLANQLM